MTGAPRPARAGTVLAVALVSAALLGYEISLLRVLLVASWHHFAFLVLSCALLGFGASGTALFAARRFVERRADAVVFFLALGAAVAMPLCTGLSQEIGVEARFAPALVWRYAWRWALFWALLAVPFLLGAAAIGAALLAAGRRTALVYGANMLGAAAGAMAAPALMVAVPPAWLPVAFGGVAWLGAGLLVRGAHRLAALGACAGIVALWVAIDAPHIRMDPFKRGAFLAARAEEGRVTLAGRLIGPRAVVEAYAGEILHDAAFLSPERMPPPVSVILADGHTAGAVYEVSRAEEAAAADGALLAFAWLLAPAAPRAALLGETGGQNVWLAARRVASAIDTVQPDPNVIDLLRGPLRQRGGAVLDLPGLRLHVAEPRHFIDHAEGPFDLIQLCGLESSAGSGGIGGLAEDHLVTVEGVATCLARLSPTGLLAVGRAIQEPPRDNIKLAATFIEALRRTGCVDPGRHLVIVRDFLAVCTIARVSPWEPQDSERIRALCRERQLTPVWFPGVRPDELNRPDALTPAPDGVGDCYHYATRELVSGEAAAFIEDYAFDVRPPTDDRPFFSDFFRMRSIPALRRAFGDQWPARAELAFLFVLAAVAASAVAGAAASIAPLSFVGLSARAPERWALAFYFGSIGLAYLMLEVVFLSRLTQLVGDAVRAAAVTIGGFLAFSGLGSVLCGRIEPRRARWLAVLVVPAGAAALWVLPSAGSALGGLPAWGRLAASVGLVAAPAFLMGFPMPLALARLRGGQVAWAWGCNGFASVLAAPLAMAVAMTWGYRAAGAAALFLYAAAALLYAKLPAPGSEAGATPPDGSGPAPRHPSRCRPMIR